MGQARFQHAVATRAWDIERAQQQIENCIPAAEEFVHGAVAAYKAQREDNSVP